jgi:hypothetical protein
MKAEGNTLIENSHKQTPHHTSISAVRALLFSLAAMASALRIGQCSQFNGHKSTKNKTESNTHTDTHTDTHTHLRRARSASHAVFSLSCDAILVSNLCSLVRHSSRSRCHASLSAFHSSRSRSSCVSSRLDAGGTAVMNVGLGDTEDALVAFTGDSVASCVTETDTVVDDVALVLTRRDCRLNKRLEPSGL